MTNARHLSPVEFVSSATSMVALVVLLMVRGSPLQAQIPVARSFDSAGIHIVQNGKAAAAPFAFALGTTPILDVGGLSDDSLYEFDARNPFLTATLLRDGRVAVGDASVVKVFGTDGKLRWFAGKSGAGPGAFGAIAGICRIRGDSLLAVDLTLRRVTVMGATGRVARTMTLPGDPVLHPCMEDGSIVYRSARKPSTPERRVRAAFSLQLGMDSAPRPLGVFPDNGLAAFTRYTTLTASGTSIYLGDEDRLQVLVFDAWGKLVRIVRADDIPEKISPEDQKAALESVLPRGTSKQVVDEVRARLLATTEMATTWPPIERMLVEDSGRIWVTGRKMPGQQREWVGFDAAGQLLGRVKEWLPAGWRRSHILQFATDRVLLSAMDPDGAKHILVLPLKRS